MRAFVTTFVVANLSLELGSPANAQETREWTATLQLERGSTTHCQIGHRGKMSIKNNVLTWTAAGWTFPIWSVPLSQDGSADQIVPVNGAGGSAGTAQVIVPAGFGPREIRTINRSACRHLYVPDSLPK